MMKQTISAVLFLFFLGVAFANSQELDMKFPTDHGFVIILDESWTEIPKEVMDTLVRETENQQRKMISWDYGYQSLDAKGWFNCPYILIDVSEIGRLPRENFKKHSKSVKELNEEINIINPLQAKIVESNFDDKAKRLNIISEFNVPEKGRITCVSALIYTEKGYIEVGGYVNKDESEKYIPFYKKVINTIELDPSLVYKEKLTDYVPVWLKKEAQHLFNYIIGGLFALAAVAFIVKIRAIKRSKS